MIRNILFSLLTLIINKIYSQKINQEYKIHPKKIFEKIKIDGQINENVWKEADVAKNFFMITPTDGKKAQQESEVRILYDEKYIYFGIDFFNSVSLVDETFKSKSPSETLSPTLTSTVSIFPDSVEGISTLDLSLSIVTTGSFTLI